MPVLTEFCDLFGAIREEGFNNIIVDIQNQRPSLFNYGTVSFVKSPQLLCDGSVIARVDPDVNLLKNPVVKQLDLLSIPGYNGPYGLEYCLQLTKLEIDFQPSNTIQLSAGLTPPLQNQEVAIQAKVCIGIGIPETAGLTHAILSGSGNATPASEKPTIPFPFNAKSLVSFSLDIFAVFKAKQVDTATDPFIGLELDSLELPGLTPAGLESTLESYIKVVLALGILPQVKFALSSLVLNIGHIFTIKPTPVSTNVPFNPSIEKDQIGVFLTLN